MTFGPQLAPLVTLDQRYISTKLEVSKVFLSGENRRHMTDGQTDRVQRLMGPLRRAALSVQFDVFFRKSHYVPGAI